MRLTSLKWDGFEWVVRVEILTSTLAIEEVWESYRDSFDAALSLFNLMREE